jgi:hypothetical protein
MDFCGALESRKHCNLIVGKAAYFGTKGSRADASNPMPMGKQSELPGRCFPEWSCTAWDYGGSFGWSTVDPFGRQGQRNHGIVQIGKQTQSSLDRTCLCRSKLDGYKLNRQSIVPWG